MLFLNGVWLAVLLAIKTNIAASQSCSVSCPRDTKMVCGFNQKSVTYKVFANQCSMDGYTDCYKMKFDPVPLKYCVKSDVTKSRRYYHETCPTFCPQHYRPVCATPKWRGFAYRTFNNRCLLQLLNCRGADDSGYEEVPLSYCHRHLMKNIFKDQVVITNQNDYLDY